MAFAAMLFTRQNIEVITRNKKNLCDINAEPKSYNIVVLDVTDSLNAVQRTFVGNQLDRIKRSVEKEGRISVYLVTRRLENKLKAVIELCNPGTSEDYEEFTGNPKLAEKKWEGKFSSRLDSIFDFHMVNHGAQFSPILETIQAISLTGLPDTTSKPVRVYLFSDMLQHMPGYTHYAQRPPKFKTLKALPYYVHVRTRLRTTRKAEFELYYARRERQHKIQGGEHIKFWSDYIMDIGGKLVKEVQIQG